MNFFQAIFLGLVQALTEYLPVSSSAHIRIIGDLMLGSDPGAAFTAIIQIGTELAVILYFRHDIIRILGAWFGVLLWVVDARSKQVKTMKEMTWKDALIFGIGQMLALIPGVSRSGGTITFGRAMGYTREAAVRVSFLMAIPAVFGAGILEAVSAVKDVAAGDAGMFPGWGPTIAAAIVAFVVGYVVIGFLKFVSTFSYKAFAIYRIGLAIVVALLLITGVLSPLEAAAAA